MTPFTKLYRTMIPPPFIHYRPTIFFKALFNAQPLHIAPLRFNTSTRSSRRLLSSGETFPRTDQPISLAWLQLHDHSPASYGIQAFDGYTELIPPKTPLPCKKSTTMESAFDYIRNVSFGICGRRTMLDLPVEIAEDAELDNIRIAKQGVTKFKVTMLLGKDLMGNFIVQDTWTRSKVSIDFDGGKALEARTDNHSMIAS